MASNSSPPDDAIPVYLLTGFLGSGKTTLLSRLVRSAAFADTAVIINEFGQVGLDHVLVGQARDDDVVLMDSGCLCCAMSTSLQDSLETLYYRRLRGEIPRFARVVIETSGLADPAPLITTLGADVSVARHYRFAGAVTTVDAVHGLQTIDRYREAATQVAIADRLILTKTDLCDTVSLLNIQQALPAYNPTAALRLATLTASQGEADFFADWTTPSTVAPDSACVPASASALRLGHVLRYGITSYTFHVDTPVSWTRYAKWVRHLQQHGDALLRLKAILAMDDGEVYAIHAVRHLFSPPQRLTQPIAAPQLGAIVIIAQDLSREEAEAAIEILSPS